MSGLAAGRGRPIWVLIISTLINAAQVTSAAPTLGFLIHDVARLLRRRFEQHARELGLTRSQWQTLAYLAPNEGIQQAGLAELLEIEPITLVGTFFLLFSLVAAALIRMVERRLNRIGAR